MVHIFIICINNTLNSNLFFRFVFHIIKKMHLRLLSFILFSLVIVHSNGRSCRCREYVDATYQIITDVGPFSVYQLVRLQKDGSVTSVNNVEDGFAFDDNTVSQPFTTALGEWQCLTKNQIHIRTADFNHKVANSDAPTSISWDNIVLNFTNNGDTVQGVYHFAFYPVGTYPFNSSTQPLPDSSFGPFPITGGRFRFF